MAEKKKAKKTVKKAAKKAARREPKKPLHEMTSDEAMEHLFHPSLPDAVRYELSRRTKPDDD